MDVPRLHVITDETVQARYGHLALARLALAGGADAVQFREKRPWTTRQLLDVARAIAHACQEADAVAVIDDRADVALSAGGAGLHLGRNDLDVPSARRILGNAVLIGGTANSYDEAMAVAETDVDYLGVGPVYGTRSKANPAPVMGLETLARIAGGDAEADRRHWGHHREAHTRDHAGGRSRCRGAVRRRSRGRSDQRHPRLLRGLECPSELACRHGSMPSPMWNTWVASGRGSTYSGN